MSDKKEPLIRLEPGGKAPILSYNLPEPTVYTGRCIIELPFSHGIFKREQIGRGGFRVDVIRDSAALSELVRAVQQMTGLQARHVVTLLRSSNPVLPIVFTQEEAQKAKETLEEIGAVVKINPARDQVEAGQLDEQVSPNTSPVELREQIRHSMLTGFADRRIFPLAHVSTGSLRIQKDNTDSTVNVVDTVGAGSHLAGLSVEEIANRVENNETLSFYTSLSGQIRHRFVTLPHIGQPQLLLIETFRLATYLGAYGAGPTLQTFSLLPGERTTIEVRTFLKTERERAEASSILDSFSEESATDFESSIEQEQSSKESYEKSFSYHAEAEAKASWGWGSAKVSGGAKGGTNSAREQAAKNTINATNKHAQKASAKRQVEVNTSSESRQTDEQENMTSRELENINVSRTLNFVFRQMNQQFITVLSLVDVRVAYFDGFPSSRDEVPLAEIDNLLERHVRAQDRADTREEILGSLRNIADYTGQLHNDFIEEREIAGEKYLRVRGEKTSSYTDAPSGTNIEVPGVILAASSNVMRTDGVIVEALLGVGQALDHYSSRLQELEVDRRAAELAALQTSTERAKIINDLILANDPEHLKLLEMLLGNRGSSTLELAVRPRHSDSSGNQDE